MRHIAFCLGLLTASPSSAETCRLSLALALDVSGSVDQNEYRLQAEGLAAALTDPDVEAALFAFPGAPVAVAIYEWSASRYQRLIQDWVLIDDTETLRQVAARVANLQREPAPEPTGLAAALEYGKALIDRGPDCWDQTLDVSGDGKNNDWPTPLQLREQNRLAGLRINALVVVLNRDEARIVGTETGELPAYFQANVIQGPNAFVEVADGFEDYARAMRKKLLKELATQPVGALPETLPRILRRF